MFTHISKTCGGFAHFLRSLHPAKLTLIGYSMYVIAGWLCLSLPYAQSSIGIPALDHLFIATSAVSTTGLVTISVSDNYSLFGQIVVLALIQVGGIGYMTFGSFVILSTRRTLSPERLDISRTVFSLPDSFKIDKFIVRVVLFTLVIESLGILALYPIFRNAGTENALWTSIFHSISAFCTAGFSLFNSSFEGFAGNFWLNAVIATLSYLGAIGFIVCTDYWDMLRGKIRQVTLTSRIIVWSTIWLTILGTSLIFLAEPSVRDGALDERLLKSFFQAMTAMTTVGFNTIDISGVTQATLLAMMVLMVIGASPSGTGGGLKSTTFSALVGVMRSALRGGQKVLFWGQAIPLGRVLIAIASLGFYLMLLLCGTYVLELTEKFDLSQNLFEAASALGTVGLSTGITADLSNVGKLVIIFLMFCGRLGPLTFGIALFFTNRQLAEGAESDLAV